MNNHFVILVFFLHLCVVLSQKNITGDLNHWNSREKKILESSEELKYESVQESFDKLGVIFGDIMDFYNISVSVSKKTFFKSKPAVSVLMSLIPSATVMNRSSLEEVFSSETTSHTEKSHLREENWITNNVHEFEAVYFFHDDNYSACFLFYHRLQVKEDSSFITVLRVAHGTVDKLVIGVVTHSSLVFKFVTEKFFEIVFSIIAAITLVAIVLGTVYIMTRRPVVVERKQN